MVEIRSVKDIEVDEVELHGPDGNLIGILESGIQLQDVCVQIKNQSLEGYYIMFNGYKTFIETDGRIYFHDDARPFNALTDLLRELI